MGRARLRLRGMLSNDQHVMADCAVRGTPPSSADKLGLMPGSWLSKTGACRRRIGRGRWRRSRFARSTSTSAALHILHAVEIDIPDGEFVVLVGPSGCGKSTLLRMVAGLEEITRGEIAIGGRVVNTVPPKDRDIAMVFQNYALYPHMTVRQNMAFSLKLAKAPQDRRSTSGSGGRPRSSAWRHCSTVSRASCRAASASAWPWAGPSSAIRRCSCSTSRCRTSTPSCASRCAPRSRSCTSGCGPPPSMSRTTRSRP